jgi:hypothetical protein
MPPPHLSYGFRPLSFLANFDEMRESKLMPPIVSDAKQVGYKIAQRVVLRRKESWKRHPTVVNLVLLAQVLQKLAGVLTT